MNAELADAAPYAAVNSERAHVMAAILKLWSHTKNPTRQLTCIYWKNNPAKFHPNPMWNDGAFWTVLLQQQQE